ncbi:HAMP domain-containing sensor histidine kinase [Acidothermaceae bacterium B102]|nr:HAMP domain-containing sensor histidine kinase [Acidothermaceae bacterium B102]
MSRRHLTGDDAALVRGTARRIALQGAALVALVVLVLSGLAVAIALRQQHNQTDSLLTQATASADDVGDPPAGMWLTIRRGTVTRTTPGAPDALPDLAALAAVAATQRSDLRDLHADREYRIRTVSRQGSIVQAALDLSSQHAERQHLLTALLGVGAGGLVLAGAVGLVMGRRAVRPLASALALQRDFVADASHELRTPLTLLSTRAQLLARALESADVSERVHADSQGVVRDTSRLVSVVEDLLIAAQGMDGPGHATVDIAQIAVELADSAQAHAAERGIALQSSTPEEPLLVHGSAVALRRALTALVDNALAHTPDRGSVTILAGRDREGVTVDVVDTGAGIDPAVVDRIFDRFHSGGQRAGRRSYGLGLSLASGVAARHKGSLSVVESGPTGTTFRLRLPEV